MTTRPNGSTSAASKSTILNQIKRLAELRDQSIITVAEFETKKVELLARYDIAPDIDPPASTGTGQTDYANGWPGSCEECGGEGTKLRPAALYCSSCRWLRPLAPDYRIETSQFMWSLDEQAMSTLQSLGPLTDAAHGMAERYGRRWFEAAVNGVRLSDRQLPEIHHTAVRAARLLGMPYLPEIYVSGEQMWDCMTLGSNDRAFIVLGSVLTNFAGDDLLFILAREMGHIRAGHAMWKTALQFLSGRTSERRTVMGDGVLQFLNPVKLVENAIDVPMMAWARHSEITADRAGLLAVGSMEVARRVLLMCTLRSFPLYPQINQAAWLEQEDAADNDVTKFAERTMTTIPFVAPRLRLLREFAQSDELRTWRTQVALLIQKTDPAVQPTAARRDPGRKPTTPAPSDPNTIRLVCAKCKQAMRISRASLEGKGTVTVRCPNAACRALLTVSGKPSTPPRSDLHATE